MPDQDYVHGYSQRESDRLNDQAGTLAELLHNDTVYPPGSTVLEVGCGVGAQTVILARNCPKARFTAIDISRTSIEAAKALLAREKITNVSFENADIFELPYKAETFDHVFVCFVLEHLRNPVEALLRLKKVLKKEGTLTVIEGDHGSTFFHPEGRAAQQAINCLIHLQARLGGNTLIGRQLYPLLKNAGFKEPDVSPRFVYVDSSKPELVEGFTRNTFIAMVEGVKQLALEARLIDEDQWEQGIRELHAAAATDGVFCYTFFKGVAIKS
ncbi:MAG TPA: methyltransferase domain-containing protein [Geobacteraceae bacterium]|nr:methyltransferase domain-containing protein [Geobacteraceae bacterium]